MLFLIVCKSARLSMLLTTFIPGGGQFYTENYVKGVIVGGVQSYFAYKTYKSYIDWREINKEFDNTGDSTLLYQKDQKLSEIYEDIWWDALVWSLSVVDAYIDAHLYKFNTDITFNKDKISIGLTYRF